MIANSHSAHIVRNFVLRRGPDGSLFELPNRLAEKFDRLCHQLASSEVLKSFAKYRVH
jgi:uncharacterized protein YheU (UPF0270 family)